MSIKENYSGAEYGENPKVNLKTGKLSFAFAEIGLGGGNYRIDLAHIYNSESGNSLAGVFPGMGKGWKLNIQHYVQKDGDDFRYVDGMGTEHRFICFNKKTNRYYDERDAGVVLKEEPNGTKIITDGMGNQLLFDVWGRLYESVSCENRKIAKCYSYNAQGQLIEIYDRRYFSETMFGPRLKFVYGGGKLKEIVLCGYSVQDYPGSTQDKYVHTLREEEKLMFTYNNDLLMKVERMAVQENKSKTVAEFSYTGDGLLSQVKYPEEKAGVQMTYENAKVKKIASGVYQDSGAFCEKESETFVYLCSSGKANYVNEATVTNEKGIVLSYFMDKRGNIVSSFEKCDGGYKSLSKVSEKRIVLGANQETINGVSTFSFSGETEPLSVDFDLARSKVEKGYRYFTCSFWLKHFGESARVKAKLTYEVFLDSTKTQTQTQTEEVWVNAQAYGAYQSVSLPIVLPAPTFDGDGTLKTGYTASLNKLTLSILNEEEQAVSCQISPLYFAPGAKESFLLNGIEPSFSQIPDLEKINQVSGEQIGSGIETNGTIYMTENDLIRTMSAKFAQGYKVKGGNTEKDCFDLICNGGTKRIANVTSFLLKEVDVVTKDPKFSWKGDNKEWAFCKQMITPDGKSETSQDYHYEENGLELRTWVMRYSTGNGDSGANSKTYSKSDYKGKPLYEEDAYGVKKEYTYDEYGNLIKEELIGANGTKGAYKEYVYDVEPGRIVSQEGGRNVTAYGTTGQYLVSAGGAKTGEFFDYLTPHGVVNKVQKTSKGAYHAPTGVAESSTFDPFKEKVTELKQSVSDAQKGKITVTYENGQVRTVGNGTVTYGAKYDLVNDKAEYTLFNGETETTLETLQKTSGNDHYDTITRSCYRAKDGTPDRMGTEYDPYGRIFSIDENGEKVGYFEYSNGIESKIAQKVIEMDDEHRDRYDGDTLLDFAKHYDYDPDWNLIGWHETYGYGSQKVLGLSVRQINAGETKYTFPDGEKYFAAIGYDESILIQPRVTTTSVFVDLDKNEADNQIERKEYQRNYQYDDLGRISEIVGDDTQTSAVGNTVYTSSNIFTASCTYAEENNQALDHITHWDVKNHYTSSSSNTMGNSQATDIQTEQKFSYRYDELGNVTKVIETGSGSQNEQVGAISKKTTLIPAYQTEINYSYDKLNRLIKEENPLFGLNHGYSYCSDGRFETWRGESCNYDSFGRLTKVGTREYAYDFYGNRIGKAVNGTTTASYAYERGNKLKSVNSKHSYRYDSNGVRIEKTSEGSTICYYTDGSKILGEDRTDGSGNVTKLRYFYDALGLCGIKCNTVYYTYVRNAFQNITMILNGNTPAARYAYDAFGRCKALNPDGSVNESSGFIGNINPFRWKSHYFDTESGLYYIEGNYYDPETGLYLNACSVAAIIDEPFSDYTLDRNGIMCDNILELLPYMYAIYTMQELSADPMYDSKENKSWWDWGTFWKGLSWVLTAIAAMLVSVATFGAATPLLLGIIAGITLGAGILTGINGIATMIEAGTSYNFVRDTIFIGNENAFNIYGGIVGGIATVGTIICGIYQLTSPIKGFTKHGLERTLAREGHGVNARAMQETVRKPIEIVTQSNGGIKFIGKNAVVVLNEVGKVITTWAKNSSAWRYLILLCLGYSLTEEN